MSPRWGRLSLSLEILKFYGNRKEEIISRMFGVIDPGHPYIQLINKGGPYLLGGEIELLDKITYNDGLDKMAKKVRRN